MFAIFIHSHQTSCVSLYILICDLSVGERLFNAVAAMQCDREQLEITVLYFHEVTF